MKRQVSNKFCTIKSVRLARDKSWEDIAMTVHLPWNEREILRAFNLYLKLFRPKEWTPARVRANKARYKKLGIPLPPAVKVRK